MDELRKLDKSLRSLGEAKRPSLEQHVMVALTSGELPKLKSAAKISGVARTKIINSGYSSNRTLSFGDVFASCNGFETEMKQFSAHEKTRASAVSKYTRSADVIMLRAFDKDADAEAISEELHEAAERAGLKSMQVPVFGTVAESD